MGFKVQVFETDTSLSPCKLQKCECVSHFTIPVNCENSDVFFIKNWHHQLLVAASVPTKIILKFSWKTQRKTFSLFTTFLLC